MIVEIVEIVEIWPEPATAKFAVLHLGCFVALHRSVMRYHSAFLLGSPILEPDQPRYSRGLRVGSVKSETSATRAPVHQSHNGLTPPLSVQLVNAVVFVPCSRRRIPVRHKTKSRPQDCCRTEHTERNSITAAPLDPVRVMLHVVQLHEISKTSPSMMSPYCRCVRYISR